jgi:hypothetical protein
MVKRKAGHLPNGVKPKTADSFHFFQAMKLRKSKDTDVQPALIRLLIAGKMSAKRDAE